MAKKIYNEYLPYYVSPPGGTLLDGIESLGISRADLAKRLGQPIQIINDLILGQAPLTFEMALQLEEIFGLPARFWNKREQKYRESLARKKDEGPFEGLVVWLSEMPVKEMIAMGWLEECEDAVEQLQELLFFFGVVSPGQWRNLWLSAPNAILRHVPASQRDLGVLAAWLRQGSFTAREIDCQAYDEKKFRHTLPRIRALAALSFKAVFEQLVQLCAQAGVAVTLVPTLPQTNIHSAARWLAPDEAIIQLNHRHERLWESFFYQTRQLLLGKKELSLEYHGQLTIQQQPVSDLSTTILMPQTVGG